MGKMQFTILLLLCFIKFGSSLLSVQRAVLQSNSLHTGIYPSSIVPVSLLLSSNDLETEVMSDENEIFSQKQKLREETEAPFRNVRIYLYISLLSAASLSTFIGLAKIAAALSIPSQADFLPDLYYNLSVNLIGIPVIAYFWKRDLDSRQSILQRIQRGGSLAGLKLKIQEYGGSAQVVKISELRRDRGIEKRLVIVAAPKPLLATSVQSSMALGKDLYFNDLLIVPIVIELEDKGYKLSSASIDSLASPTVLAQSKSASQNSDITSIAASKAFVDHIGLPVGMSQWNDVLKRELGTALKQQPDTLGKGDPIHTLSTSPSFNVHPD
jgi:hypothetical protein